MFILKLQTSDRTLGSRVQMLFRMQWASTFPDNPVLGPHPLPSLLLFKSLGSFLPASLRCFQTLHYLLVKVPNPLLWLIPRWRLSGIFWPPLCLYFTLQRGSCSDWSLIFCTVWFNPDVCNLLYLHLPCRWGQFMKNYWLWDTPDFITMPPSHYPQFLWSINGVVLCSSGYLLGSLLTFLRCREASTEGQGRISLTRGVPVGCFAFSCFTHFV